MKRIVFAAIMMGLCTAASAQDIPQRDVPSLVLSAFQEKFSDATDVSWEKEADLYKVEFEIGNRDHDLWIDKSGNIIKHKEEFFAADLPKAVSQKIKTDFKGYRIDDVERIETNGKVIFQVELDSRSGDREVMFLQDGTVYEGRL